MSVATMLAIPLVSRQEPLLMNYEGLQKGLPWLPLSIKMRFTGYLLTIGFGLLMAGAQIMLTHGMADGKPGLTVDDMLMGVIFVFAVGIPEWIKASLVTIPFAFLIIDVISWWLTKLNPEFAWITIIGGYGYSLASTAMLFISLYQMWILPWKLAKEHHPST
jgi:hypothetical protein